MFPSIQAFRRRQLFKISILFLPIFFYSYQGVSFARGQDATLTTKQIYEMASKRIALIKNLSLVATVEWKNLPDLPPNHSGPPSLGRHSFAFLGDRRLNTYAKILEGGNVEKRPPTFVFNGKTTFLMELPKVHVFEGKQLQCDNEWYCDYFLNLRLTDEERARERFDSTFPQCLNPDRGPILSPLPYKVLPKLEAIDGHLCHVLEYENNDKLWVDSKLGGALRQRIRFARFAIHGPGQPPVKYQHYSLGDYIEGAPGIWVPKKASWTVFGPAKQAGKPSSQPWNELRIQVESIKINQIDAQFFNLEVPAKSILVKKEGSLVMEGEKPICLNDIDPGFKPEVPTKPPATEKK